MNQQNQETKKNKKLSSKKSSRFEEMCLVEEKTVEKNETKTKKLQKNEEKETKKKKKNKKEKENKTEKNDVAVLTFSQKKIPSPRKKKPENPLFLDEEKVKKPKLIHKIQKKHTPLQRFSSLGDELNKLSKEGSIVSPKKTFVLKCVSKALKKLVLTEEEEENYKLHEFYAIFDESKQEKKIFPSIDYQVPVEEEIYQFLYDISLSIDLHPESFILMLVYIERMIKKTGSEWGIPLALTSKTWKRIVLVTLLCGFKIWQDVPIWNVDFTCVNDNLRVSDLNELEGIVLTFLEFDVSVNKATYTKYYIELSNLIPSKDMDFPFLPLDEKMENKLMEINRKSKIKENRKKMNKLRSYQSSNIILVKNEK
ncbi:cyclin y isoform a [Anaeramoeba flamelloides]|uniref:Cyclin y isoform a n=1 Tax=Anaeramoeba flamelloides TaxID=1746091 RepID=A0AAV7YN26_9EUKA|nr:cyclin y isoform a [Anaeramoeba flamelloides]